MLNARSKEFTKEELARHKAVTHRYMRESATRNNEMQVALNHLIFCRNRAVRHLPTQADIDAAMQPDLAPFPAEYRIPTWTPPDPEFAAKIEAAERKIAQEAEQEYMQEMGFAGGAQRRQQVQE